ncbi:hypothetical protein [Oryzobacter telluris]|uniref:hypothetical protein n=1 Tax=Oryzobacter telluris TaxID=3149179 RepID=UPI00370D3BC3
MTRHRAPGRRRAPGAVRRLPDGFSRLSASWAVKSVASLCVVGGAAAALALPVGAEPGAAALSLPVATTSAVEGRAAGLAASRSAARAAQAPQPAVSAPADAAPAAPDQVGIFGVKAVAKPKPKPKATATESASSGGDTSAPKVTGISAKCSGLGLTNRAAILCTAVQKKFGLASIGGYRPNAGEHSTGQAVDFMTGGSSSTGDAVAAFVLANASTYNVKYVIWQQRYREPGGSWEMMEDRGSPTANHMDHVHVTVN